MESGYYACLETQRQHWFDSVQQAIADIQIYRHRLAAIAREQKLQGKIISDQDHPTEVIALRPRQTELPPLLLIGGMGPLAGINSFEQACQIFQHRREIVLFQACPLPSRTEVMQQKAQALEDDTLERQLVAMLEAAIRAAVGLFHLKHTLIQAIVLCNAAHYFLPNVIQRLQQNHPEIASKLQWLPLIESVVQYLQDRNLQRPLVLSTSATRLGRVYTQPLQTAGITYLEPNPMLQQQLMDCIYQGVKAGDRDYACAVGESFFEELFKTQPVFDCIIAGCSEIPCLVEWLESASSASIRQLLSQIEVINPVEIALHRASGVLPVVAVAPTEALTMRV